jgi:hypothetical protein
MTEPETIQLVGLTLVIDLKPNQNRTVFFFSRRKNFINQPEPLNFPIL